MAAPNHADQPPPSAPAPPTAGHDDRHQGAAPEYQDPTQHLTQLFAGATLGRVPMDAPDHVEQTPAAAAEAGASSAAPAAGHDPGVTSSVGDDLSRGLAAVLAKARPLGTPPPALKHFFDPPPAPAGHVPGVQYRRPDVIYEIIMAKLAGGAKLGSPDGAAAMNARALAAAGYDSSPLYLAWTRARQGEPAGGHAERAARQREIRRLSKLPTDYLRAGQESHDRRRRRGMVRRCVRTLLSLHEDRRNEHVLSAMMARLATMESASAAGDSGGATLSAAPGDASAAEHPELADLVEKMELSFKY